MSNSSNSGKSFGETLSEVVELRLYLVTLAIQGFVWWWSVRAMWTVGGWFVALPVDARTAGYLWAMGLVVWSASTFWYSGEGRRWHEKIGAEDPSDGESRLIRGAFNALGKRATDGLPGLGVYVVDSEDQFAFIRGRSLVLSRGLVESSSLAAVLAHEVAHARSSDALLMQALDRLVLWGDPLVRARDEDTLAEYGTMAALVVGGLRWFLRAAGGALTLRLLAPLWARYWRQRELEADREAFALGQGPALAKYLKNWKQPTECPNPRLLFNLQEYVRVAYRLDVLLGGEPIAA